MRKTSGLRVRQRGFLRSVLGWLLVGVAIWGAYTWSARRAQQGKPGPVEAAVNAVRPSCADPFPAPGVLAGANAGGIVDNASAATTFVNHTAYDMLLELGPESAPRHSLALPQGASVSATVPTGAYAWRLRRGAAWCGREQRFVREQRIEITTPLELVASSRLTVMFDPGAGETGIAISTRDQPLVSVGRELPSQATAFSTDGRLVLARERDGHYRIDGAIDDAPLRFIIDTGASEIAVSQAFAQRLGVYSGQRVVSRTANGTVEGYAFVAKSVRVGPFTFENVRVTALPVLEGDALLGMRVLQAFEITQSGDALVLVPAAARGG